MSLRTKLQEDLKLAMRASDKRRVGALRLVVAEIQKEEIASQAPLEQSTLLILLRKMVKQRQDAMKQYQTAQRQDLADQESFEIALLSDYLPAQLSEKDMEAKIISIIKALGAEGPHAMSKVMNALKADLQGSADMSLVSQKVKSLLTR